MGGNGVCGGDGVAMLSSEEALNIVLNVAQRLPPITVSLHEALGKVLAEDIRAPDPLPPYPASVKVRMGFLHHVLLCFIVNFLV